MNKTLISVALGALLMASCSPRKEQTASYSVIPLPQEIVSGEGADFKLTDKTVIVAPADNDSLNLYAGFLSEYIGNLTGNQLKIVAENPGKDAIVLTEGGFESGNPEGYQLTVTDSLITIDGTTAAGTFYGIQTLRKSIPAKEVSNVLFPPVQISDYPRFAYRGAHLDISRHFFPVDSVKSFIDMIALHNINRMHWHLTDDQGWRIEIKSRPRLAEIASKRSGTVIGHNTGEYDSIPVEGYYTQDQIRDIVKYAADRNIEVIPEIDLPGHMVAALAAYPELGCTGGPYEVWKQWGVSQDLLCAGNDSTYKFLEDVLGEVVELFPSKLFHVGGDECPKDRWKECPKCQARIKQLGLKSDSHSSAEAKLQSYVMEYAANYLSEKGRRMIGWDEIIEGGMSPDAIIMSWRGEEGGIESAKLGHDVIMTPNTYLYFDYYQTRDHNGEPDAIGGFLPVEKVYSYEPYPASLTPEEQKHIIGVQANMWTEYIPTYSQVEYMELPRMAALSEVQWTMPEKKDYEGFKRRIPQIFAHYDANGYRYAKHLYDVTPTLAYDPEKKAVVATFETIDDAPIYYTLDGTEPTESANLYQGPVELTQTSTLKAAAFRPSGHTRVFTDSVTFNKATGHPIELKNEPNKQFSGHGPSTLNDGMYGASSYETGTWLGWAGPDMIATIDLEEEQSVSEVSFNTFVATGSWVFDIRKAVVELSNDGKTYHAVATEEYPALTESANELVRHTLTFPAETARFVRVTAVGESKLPDWHPGKGSAAFYFVDEIVIE